MAKLAPSILSADFSDLAADVARTEAGGAHLLHIDVMDGHFVPNISFGAVVMKSLLGKTRMPFDVHLMITDPETYFPDFLTDNTDRITVHVETLEDPKATLEKIRAAGVRAGITLNPETDVEAVKEALPYADMVLVMSVHPGFGGQSFIPESLDKVRKLKEWREELGLSYEIEIDGGINLENVEEAVAAGVDIAVAGSAVFGAEDVTERTRAFCEKIR